MIKNHKILVTGGNGMVGSLVNFGIRLNHKELDVCNNTNIKKVFSYYKPSAILHLAALDINSCQLNPKKAYEVNVLGTLNIAKECRENMIKMIYISSCIIFDGTKRTPYTEDDIPTPIHLYGLTKAIGESITLDLIPNSIIIRPGWLFGNHKVTKGFVNICLDKFKKNEDLEVLTLNRIGSPTYIPDFLEEVKKLINKDTSGIYHVVNQGQASYFELGKEIKKLGKFKAKIKKTKDQNIKETPKRGRMEALTSRKIRLRTWQDALADYLKAI